jgi:PAS domain S-box-containing protein
MVRLNDQRFRLLSDRMPRPVAYIDNNQCFQYANRAHDHWYGSDQKEIRGRHVRVVLGNEAYEVLRPHLEYALAGTTAEYETCLPNMDGGERYVQVTCLPDIDETGSVAGCFIMAEDITARKEAEMAFAAA